MHDRIIDPDLKSRVDDAVRQVLPDVIAFRHERHRLPELSWQEHATASAVAAYLRDQLHLTVEEGVGKLGVVAMIEGASAGPTLALRADMDALPIQETSGKAHASCVPGVMHACGHDGHMANLLGAAMVLTRLKKDLKGQVKLIFQPAEEAGGGGGAEVMCQAGVLRDPAVDVIFGLHGWPELQAGHVYVRTGALLAATADFKVTIQGTGCHAAMPHLGTDQVLIAARIIDALQSIRSRVIPPYEPFALSVTRIQGGTANNVIPSQVEFGGTIRAVDGKIQALAIEQLKTLSASIAESHGAKAVVDIRIGYPPTMNHAGPTDFLEKIAREILPAEHVHRKAYPSMGGEDFAYYLQRIPGSYFFLGMDDGRQGSYPSLHHPAYDFNDEALPVGIKIFVHAALAYADHGKN